VRVHAEPAWLPVAGAIAYPKASGFLLLGFILILGASAASVRAGVARPVWAVPLLVLALLYPLLLVIWHGDSAAIPRHSLPVGVELRLSMLLLALFIVDAVADRWGAAVPGSFPATGSTSPSMAVAEGDPAAFVGRQAERGAHRRGRQDGIPRVRSSRDAA
jgi:hypothetical protein